MQNVTANAGRAVFDVVDDLVVPDEDQTACKVRRSVRTKLKVISALSKPSKTVFSLTDAALASYIRRYEATIGQPLDSRPPVFRTARNVSALDDAEAGAPLPASEVTTVRIRKALRAELKAIAKREKKTLFDLTDDALQNFIARFEAAAGTRVSGD